MLPWELKPPQPWLHLDLIVPGWLYSPLVNHHVHLGTDGLININSSAPEKLMSQQALGTCVYPHVCYLFMEVAVPLAFFSALAFFPPYKHLLSRALIALLSD